MKKKDAIIVCLLILSICMLSACKSYDNISYSKIDEKTFLTTLEEKEYLPKDVTDSLRAYSNEKTSEGEPFGYWREEDAKGEIVQKIELNFPDGEMTRYHYKSYINRLNASNKMSITSGETLAMDFINTFRPDISALKWSQGEGISSIYDPGNVEAWIAEDDTHKYCVMVNLNTATLDYFSQEDK